MAISKTCHDLSVNKKGEVKFKEHEALNLKTVKHKELVPNVMKELDEEILKISQNSIIIKGKEILSFENETLKKRSFEDLAKKVSLKQI